MSTEDLTVKSFQTECLTPAKDAKFVGFMIQTRIDNKNPTSEFCLQTFAEFQLSPQILRAVQEMGYETPSPIQQQALPILLGAATDFLGLAGTGTGKTAAFAIPLLERIDPKKRVVQSLILCPTRELAMQVAGQIDLLGKYNGVRSVTVYGGAPFGDQVRGLKGGAQIVVGTPGRVIDHLERGTLNLSQVSVLVLDEADEMFSMGFKEELDKILAGVPKDGSNTWLFSATMSREVRRTVEENLHEPKTVQVNRTAMLSTGVEQYFYRSQENEKPEMICKLIEAADDFYGLIFCQTKLLVANLTRFMLDRGYKVDCLHGDMDQNSRERTMQAFRDKKLSVLICTDVAARGLDVKDITHVVNYSLPREMESYVHRIGRTARSGKTGIVMNLLTFSHRHLLGRIEQHTKVQMKEAFVPSKREIAAKKVARLLPRLTEQPFASRVSEVMGEEFRTHLATMSPEDVASHFIAMMMPDIFGGEESRKSKKAVRTVAPSVASAAVSAPSAPKAVPFAPAAAPAPIKEPAIILAPEESPALIEKPVLHSVAKIEAAPVEIAAKIALDIFGDEAAEKKKQAFVDEPPRTRSRKPVLDDEQIASLLEEPPTFGVVKASTPIPRAPREDSGFPRERRDERPRFAREDSRPRRDSFAPRSQSQFRPGGPARSPDARFERSSPKAGYRSYGDSREESSRPSAARGPGGPGGPGGPVSRPDGVVTRAPRNRVYEARPSAPANLAKPPKHEPGPARTAREGETGGLNRRARRAALYGRSLDGATETSSQSTSSN